MHAVHHAHQHAHDVLDPDDGDAALAADPAQHVGGLLHLVLVEAAEALVGEQELRAGGERLGELQLLQRRRAEPVDRRRAVGRQARPAPSARSAASNALAARVPALAVEARRAPRSRGCESRRNGRGIWKVRPMPRLMMRCGGQPADLAPLEADRARGRRAACRTSMLKIVLLPEPFGPIRPRISPCSTSNETSLTAVKPPKRLVRPSTAQHAAHARRAARHFAA